MDNPKVTIITVVFNDVSHIEKTIQNVLKQTYNNIEYIVVDGASTDGTTEIIRKYRDRLIWLSEPDNGIYDAMMKGVKIASGEWLLFRNCGDFFISSNAIEQLFNKYQKDNGEDFLLADTRFFTEYGYVDKKPAILTKSYLDTMPVLHPSTFIRRKTQLIYPFHLEYKNSADYCFFVEAFNNGASYKYFNMLLSLFDRGTGMSTVRYDRTLKDNIKFLSRYGASRCQINNLKRSLLIFYIVNNVKRIIPCLNKYFALQMKKEGWIECSKDIVLKDI